MLTKLIAGLFVTAALVGGAVTPRGVSSAKDCCAAKPSCCPTTKACCADACAACCGGDCDDCCGGACGACCGSTATGK